MARRWWRAWVPAFAGAWISTVIAVAAVADPAASSLFATPTIQLPAPPALTQVRKPVVPIAFCSEDARSDYIANVFNPTVDAANDNVQKANAYLQSLTRASDAAATTADSLAGRQAFNDYRPVADRAYQFGVDIQTLRPAIMAVPLRTCDGASDAQYASSAPSGPAPSGATAQPDGYAPVFIHTPAGPPAQAAAQPASARPAPPAPQPAVYATVDPPSGPAAADATSSPALYAQAPPPFATPPPSRPPPVTRVVTPASPGPAMAAGRPMPIGPKRTIAVGAIAAAGGFERSEDWNAGPALSSMLAKSLTESGRVILVERNQLEPLLNEAQMRAARVTGADPAPPVRMIPAQYLVVGSVTEFGAPNNGGGFSLGGSDGGSGFGGGLSIRTETGKISIDLRILDTRTSQVVSSFTVTKVVKRTGVAIVTNYQGLSVGGDKFNKTPLGEACRQALEEATQRILDFVAQAVWEGKVVENDDGDVFVNAGAEAGLLPGDRLRIERIGRSLTDPDTGQVLSERRLVLGDMVVEQADPKVAHGRFNPIDPATLPQRGDIVTLVAGGS